MANFEPAYKITRAHEGGYANLAADKGGETWRGVARKSNPTWPGWKIVDAIKATKPTCLNVALAGSKELDALVLALFRKGYWDCLSLDSLHCQQTASQLFDVSVNCGAGTAGRFLQQALNVFHKPALVVDGKVGRLTIAAANQYPSQKIYDEINKLRRAYFLSIIDQDATQGIFKDGWLSRIKPFQPDNVSNMA
jgi:lysozyme family protein